MKYTVLDIMAPAKQIPCEAGWHCCVIKKIGLQSQLDVPALFPDLQNVIDFTGIKRPTFSLKKKPVNVRYFYFNIIGPKMQPENWMSLRGG